MSIRVGITGGIGSGKSFVAKIFKTLGVPYYDADKEAKVLMSTSSEIKNALISEFGPDTYFEDGALNRKYLSACVFNDSNKLTKLNEIVHPVVIAAADEWANQQSAIYSLKEAALLFESKSYKKLDYTIVVTAPIELRISRVKQRDGASREEVLQRIDKQMPEKQKVAMADFVIINDEIKPLLPQIIKIHNTIINS